MFRPQIRSPTRVWERDYRLFACSTLRPAPLAALADYQTYFDVERGEYVSGQDIARLDQLEQCRLFHWQVASLPQTFSLSFLLLPYMPLCGGGGGGGGASIVVNPLGEDFLGGLRRIFDSDKKVEMAEEDQLRERVHKWLSPPDPSTNHNAAYAAHHKGTAAWFFQGSIFWEWKNQSGVPVLWIQGKRAPCSTSFLTPSHTVL